MNTLLSRDVESIAMNLIANLEDILKAYCTDSTEVLSLVDRTDKR